MDDELRREIEEHGNCGSSAMEKVVEGVIRHGWYCVGVLDEKVPFNYSVGFWLTHRVPEMLVFGLEHSQAHALLWSVIDQIEDGVEFEVGGEYEGLIANYPVVLRPLPDDLKVEHLRVANAYYGGDFEACQIVWPDQEGVMPWEEGYGDYLRKQYSHPEIGELRVRKFREVQPVALPPGAVGS